VPETPEPADLPAPSPPPAEAIPPPEATEPPVVPATASVHKPEHAGAGTPCQNCGTVLQGPYCHQCGQHDFDLNRSFGHTFMEALESFLHFDGKLFRNVVALLFLPGKMTVEFNAGRRAAQVPPFRFYVFVSILFFFVTFLGDRSDQDILTFNPPANQAGPVTQPQLGTVTEAWEATPGMGATTAGEKRTVDRIREAGELLQARQLEKAPAPGSGLRDTLRSKAARLRDPVEREHLIQSFKAALPKLLLLCLPLFALQTRVLFRRSGRLYLQHLVMVVHFHTFLFLWFMLRDGWGFLAGLPGWGLENWITRLCNLWLAAYPVLMLRRVFGNPWGLTLAKTAVLGLTYALTLGVVFILAGVVIIFFL
jgi:hypothetical protein